MPDMRFAPFNPLRIADRASGLNSLSVRGHNERLVLSLLLQNEATTRLEIGEKTGLSAPACMAASCSTTIIQRQFAVELRCRHTGAGARAAGRHGTADMLWGQKPAWPPLGPALAAWQQACAESAVKSTQLLLQFIELKTVVLSSFIPADICAALCTLIRQEIASINAVVGRASAAPKAIGAASLPFSSRFMVQ